MNKLTIKQRKVAYMVGIIILLIPTMWLGIPEGAAGVSGRLGSLRTQYELGETSLGNVDPTSSTMNLVLLGFRGIASNVLWMEAVEQKKKKDWGGLKSTVDSITLLQPHYRKVWEFQGWNLAYNVSSEWDGVQDRYYWVTEGLKFIIRGSDRNNHIPELHSEVGRMMGQKVGRSDEWRQFRGFFRNDPFLAKENPGQEPGPDPMLNPKNIDNYLVGKDWHLRAIELDADMGIESRHQQDALFHSKPYMSHFRYADARQREAKFDTITMKGWEESHNAYVNEFGRKEFLTLGGGKITVEGDSSTLKQFSLEDNYPVRQKRIWADKYRKMINYPYWKKRSEVEQSPEINKAHDLIIRGKKAHREGDTKLSLELLDEGIRLFEKVLSKKSNSPMLVDGDIADEAIRAVIVWKEVSELEGKEVPEDYPLRTIYEMHPETAQELERLFNSIY